MVTSPVTLEDWHPWHMQLSPANSGCPPAGCYRDGQSQWSSILGFLVARVDSLTIYCVRVPFLGVMVMVAVKDWPLGYLFKIMTEALALGLPPSYSTLSTSCPAISLMPSSLAPVGGTNAGFSTGSHEPNLHLAKQVVGSGRAGKL